MLLDKGGKYKKEHPCRTGILIQRTTDRNDQQPRLCNSGTYNQRFGIQKNVFPFASKEIQRKQEIL